jgi:hypothetical protein
MSQKKTALVVGLVALTVFGAPIAASAAPMHTDFPNVSFHTEDGEDGSDYSFDDGDSDKDDHHKSIPPVFVVPGEKHHRHDRGQQPGATPTPAPTDGSDDGSTTPDDSNTVDGATVDPAAASDFVVMGPGDAPVTDQLGGVNPEEARAIDIKKVMVTHKSPADEFVDAAYIGLGLLGASAVGLGATAGIRAIRLRRSGKTDYLYGEK